MAIWEFDVEFLPRAWCDGHRPEELINAEGSDAGIAWRAHPLHADQIVAALSSSFGAPSRPIDDNDSWLIWNDAQQNRFDLHREQGFVESFYVRIDARSSDEAGRKRVLALAAAFDCVLWPRGARAFVASSLADLATALRASRAGSFARDPRGTIEAIARDVKLDERYRVLFRGEVIGFCAFEGRDPSMGIAHGALETTSAYERLRDACTREPSSLALADASGASVEINWIALDDITAELGEPYVEVNAQGGPFSYRE